MSRSSVEGLGVAEARTLLGDGFSHDMPGRLTERVGVDIWVLDLTGDAYSLVIDGQGVIVVKRTPYWFRQNFSLAHELGHLVAGSLGDTALNDSTGHEAAANAFGAELLMPAAEVRAFDWSRISLPILADQLWAWGVSTQALSVRLQSLRLTTSAEIASALSDRTIDFLRRHWVRPAGPDPITVRMEAAAERRVPTELTSRLEERVTQGLAPVESLAFALGVLPGELDIAQPLTADPVLDLDLLEGLD